jgi:hypothetical protein
MGRGRDAEAVDVVHKVATYNGKTSRLTLEHLAAAGELAVHGDEAGEKKLDTSALGAVRRVLSLFSSEHVRALFATRKLAYSTSLLIVLWGKWLI